MSVMVVEEIPAVYVSQKVSEWGYRAPMIHEPMQQANEKVFYALVKRMELMEETLAELYERLSNL